MKSLIYILEFIGLVIGDIFFSPRIKSNNKIEVDETNINLKEKCQ